MKDSFEAGDFVRFVNAERVKPNIFGHIINVFKIKSIDGSTITLYDVDTPVDLVDIMPILIDGVEDRWIYYRPIIAASIVLPGQPIPTHTTDYSYYLDALKRCTYKDTTFYEMIMEQQLKYVHEVQHFLRNIAHSDDLKINDTKNQ